MQVETLPQSMVEIKTIILKPRLDRGDIKSIGDKVKLRLFSNFGFKPKPDDTRLLASEQYFEPYLIIGGKYVLDYCKKHVIEAEVDKKTTRLFVAGQEFTSNEPEPKTGRRIVKMTGEEHAHYEKQGYYILDRMNREISPERLPLSPFVELEKGFQLNYFFKRMNISDETQIGYLKAKIAQRPSDVAEIMKEFFEITDRTVAYYPRYSLTFENVKKQKEATVTVDGITGEIELSGMKNLTAKSISTFREATEFQITEPMVREEVPNGSQLESIPDGFSPIAAEKTTISQKKAQTVEAQPSQHPVFKEEQTEDILEPPSPVSKDEDDTIVPQTAQSGVCDVARVEPIPEVLTSEIKKGEEMAKQADDTIATKPTEDIFCEKCHAESVPDIVPPSPGMDTEDGSKHDQIGPPNQSEKANDLESQPEPILILPPGATDDTINAPKEEETNQPVQLDDERTILGFPAKIFGEVAEINDNGTTVDGDVEIPSGTNIDKDLVVRGSLKIGDNCRGHGKLQVSKDITVGADTIIDGDLISGGNIFVGPRSLINGVVEAAGVFEIEKDAVVEVASRRAPPLS